MNPLFSIIVPTYSRPQALSACLRALAELDHPHEQYEVIVVDDGSSVPLQEVVAPFQRQLTLTLIRQSNAGPAAARNAGAQCAQGEFLAFTDDDCLPEPRWLTAFAQILAKTPECMVGGKTMNVLTDNLYSITSQLIVDIVYRHYNADPLRARFIASNNLAMPARGFHNIGGFDPAFRTSEDRELCHRWLQHGHRIVYHPEACVRHAHALNFRSFCRQHFNYGRGAHRYHELRWLRKSGSLLQESRFHLNVRNWLWQPIREVPAGQVLPVATLLGLWQAANLAGFLWDGIHEAVRGSNKRVRPGAGHESDNRSIKG